MKSTLKELAGIFRFALNFKAVVITGGPCGGKSTFLKMAVAMLEKHGYRVIVVPEVARELIKAGFLPWDKSWKTSVSFQTIVLKAILEKEAFYFQSLREFADDGRPVVFICDRGLVDGAAYMGEEPFKSLLGDLGLAYAEVLDRYHGVVALVSAANGAEAHYAKDDERFESLEEAKALDVRTIAVWHGHLHLTIIDNSTGFPEKINRALIALRRVLHMPQATEIEKKYCVLGFHPSLVPEGTKASMIVQTYLLIPEKPGIECRVRAKTTNGSTSYYYTEKTATDTEGVRGEHEEQLTEIRYNELLALQADPACGCVEKTRYKIRYGSYMLELDVYAGKLGGLVTLEVEFPSVEAMAAFVPPPGFQLTDVTADKRYSNRMLAEFGKPAAN
jgi:CYTH domain-containing protein/predicted ATPase